MNNNYYVFDIEADGLLDTITQIYCLSYAKIIQGKVVESNTIVNKNEIIAFFKQEGIFVGHNIIMYDIPAVELVYDTDLSDIRLIDTIGLSWYLDPNPKKHNLDLWGERFGIKKPKVTDWKNLPLEVYIHRCEEDVKINTELFKFQMSYLLQIYDNNWNEIHSICDYLNFKLDCLKEQEENPLSANIEQCIEHRDILEIKYKEKADLLADNMPEELGVIIKNYPAKPYKKDGTLSANGIKWFQELIDRKLPPTKTTPIREKPNPGSSSQLKSWLFSLGWQPTTFKENDKGEKIPQVNLPFGAGLCPSVKDLFEEHPILEELDNLGKIKHRLGIFKAFIKHNVDGKIFAGAHGLTNTLRLKHKNPIVNLPKPDKYYGKEIRSVLYVPQDQRDSVIMCGSDVSSLEDSTKQHYIYFYDPKYVEEMRVPGFCPHLDIGILAGLITEEESEFFKYFDALSRDEKAQQSEEDRGRFKSIKKKRSVSKSTNFSATYGAGGPKIGETAKVGTKKGYELHKIYWERNKAVKQTANDVKTKIVEYYDPISKRTRKQMWLFNPVSGFWYFLKNKKDIFSTLNQGTGVYVFDNWVRNVRISFKPLGIPIRLQYHDEILFTQDITKQELVTKLLNEAMDKVNKKLKLNVNVSISVDYGFDYAECH